jgi:ABC-type multidrug transport system ATPase subunit
MLADKIAIISRGRILTNGSVPELKRRLLGPAEYELQVRGGWSLGSLDLPPGMSLVAESPEGPRFRVEDPQAANPILLEELMKRGTQVVAMQELPRTLEQVYLAAMAQVKDG